MSLRYIFRSCYSMKTDTGTIISLLRRIKKEIFPEGKGEVFLYGSRARGNATKDSDWDLLILTDDSLESSDPFLSFAFPFAELGWKVGEQITPIHYTRSQWASFITTPFYQNVIKDAIPL